MQGIAPCCWPAGCHPSMQCIRASPLSHAPRRPQQTACGHQPRQPGWAPLRVPEYVVSMGPPGLRCASCGWVPAACTAGRWLCCTPVPPPPAPWRPPRACTLCSDFRAPWRILQRQPAASWALSAPLPHPGQGAAAWRCDRPTAPANNSSSEGIASLCKPWGTRIMHVMLFAAPGHSSRCAEAGLSQATLTAAGGSAGRGSCRAASGGQLGDAGTRSSSLWGCPLRLVRTLHARVQLASSVHAGQRCTHVSS